MYRFRSRIQQKILLLLLSLALPPLIIVGWLGITGLGLARNTAVEEGINALRSQAEESLAHRAVERAQFYTITLTAIQQQVEGVASYAAYRAAEPVPTRTSDRVWVAPAPSPELLASYPTQVAYAQQMIPLLQSVIDHNTLFSIGYIALDQGGVIAFNDVAVVDKLLEIQPFDPRQRPWYIAAREAGHTIWTDAYVDANTGALATTCAAPVYGSQGQLIGVVAFDLLLSTIQQDLLTIDIGQDGYALMINRMGDVIVRPDPSTADTNWDEPFQTENLRDSPSEQLRTLVDAMLKQETGIAQITYEGQVSYIAYAPINVAGWSVGMVIPADTIVQPALNTGQRIGESQDRLQRQFTILLAVVAVAIGGGSVYLSLTFTRPIRALQHGVRAVASGKLDERLPSAGVDEIGELVNAFNSMTAALQSKVAELEMHAEQLATLNTVSNELKGILDLDALLASIPTVICERFGFDRAVLYLVKGKELQVASASFGTNNSEQAAHFIQAVNAEPLRLDSSTVEADVVRSGKAVIVEEPWNHPRVDQRKQGIAGGHSYVQVPIFGREEQVIGVLSADYYLHQRRIQHQDASQLLMFASMVGLTIQNVQLYHNLEHQVAQRTEELRAALKQAQLADRRKSDFLTGISHELRTPLNAIIGFSSVLIDELDGPLSPMQHEDAQSIHRNGRFLLHMINELLDLARIEAGRLDLDLGSINLAPIVNEVADTMHGLLREGQVSLNQNLPADLPPVHADADRLRQILFNLLSNAVKFTERGTITVSAYLTHDATQPMVVISIRDTGIGIPSDRQHEIFEEFVQVHDKRLRRRGTGLGLSIVRRLVEAHHGRIWVESTPNAGSTFSVSLPVAGSQ